MCGRKKTQEKTRQRGGSKGGKETRERGAADILRRLFRDVASTVIMPQVGDAGGTTCPAVL